jgi:hypothetical protein
MSVVLITADVTVQESQVGYDSVVADLLFWATS